MITVILALVVVGVSVVISNSLTLRNHNRKVIEHLDKAALREQQTLDTLVLVKEYYELGRIAKKEGQIAKQEAVVKVAEVTKTIEDKATELGHKIEEIPIKVQQVLKSDSDSMILTVPKQGT